MKEAQMVARWRRIVVAGAALLAGVQVTGHAALAQGSRDLADREARRVEEQRVGDVFKAMGIHAGSIVADVGAGQGFFTVRLSEAVGETGRVYAVDVSASVLRSLRGRVEREGRKNIEVVEGAADDPRLPDGALDAVLIVNAYHEMSEHQAMLQRIRKALKPGGRLVILEPISPSRRDATREAQARQHEISPEFVQRDAREAGFAVAGLEDPFSNHHGHGSEYLIVLTPAPAAAVPSDHVHEPAEPIGDLPPDIRMAASDFATLHRSGKVVVLDVRDEASFERGHIPGAKLAPMSALRDIAPGLASVQTPIVAYCSCPAEETSIRAALALRKQGVQNVRALVGGYEAWEAGGNPVERKR
jgi:ubiquinone/menaquinone biosynthesis C-methylase UbiE/rhodanese-related sulfurtransferase